MYISLLRNHTFHTHRLVSNNTFLKMAAFWDVAFSQLEVLPTFACCLRRQGDDRRANGGSKETSVNLYESTRRNMTENSHFKYLPP
jgi:hypothetical protein